MVSYYKQARKSLLLISITIIRFRTETLKYIVTYVCKDVRMFLYTFVVHVLLLRSVN